MDTKNFNKSTILIGPKAVGKSKLTSFVKESGNGEYVLSADLLINMVAHKLSGTLHLLENDKEFSEVVKLYKKNFNLNDLSPQVYEMAKIIQIPHISDASKQVILQFWKTRFVENALYGIKQPIFLDACADFGACFDLNDDEKAEVKSFLYMDSETILNRHKMFMKNFGTVVYLKPGPTYHENNEERSHDVANQLFISHPESYEKFANITLSAKDLFVPLNGVMVPNQNKLQELSSQIKDFKNQQSFE